MALCVLFAESQQYEVVGDVAGVVHLPDAVVAHRVAPHGVGPYGGKTAGYDLFAQKGKHFACGEAEVAVHVLEGEDAVGARRHAFDAETAAAVGLCHAVKGLFREGRVGGVGVQAYQNAFYRFQIFGGQHVAGHLHCVEAFAC